MSVDKVAMPLLSAETCATQTDSELNDKVIRKEEHIVSSAKLTSLHKTIKLDGEFVGEKCQSRILRHHSFTTDSEEIGSSQTVLMDVSNDFRKKPRLSVPQEQPDAFYQIANSIGSHAALNIQFNCSSQLSSVSVLGRPSKALCNNRSSFQHRELNADCNFAGILTINKDQVVKASGNPDVSAIRKDSSLTTSDNPALRKLLTECGVIRGQHDAIVATACQGKPSLACRMTLAAILDNHEISPVSRVKGSSRQDELHFENNNGLPISDQNAEFTPIFNGVSKLNSCQRLEEADSSPAKQGVGNFGVQLFLESVDPINGEVIDRNNSIMEDILYENVNTSVAVGASATKNCSNDFFNLSNTNLIHCKDNPAKLKTCISFSLSEDTNMSRSRLAKLKSVSTSTGSSVNIAGTSISNPRRNAAADSALLSGDKRVHKVVNRSEGKDAHRMVSHNGDKNVRKMQQQNESMNVRKMQQQSESMNVRKMMVRTKSVHEAGKQIHYSTKSSSNVNPSSLFTIINVAQTGNRHSKCSKMNKNRMIGKENVLFGVTENPETVHKLRVPLVIIQHAKDGTADAGVSMNTEMPVLSNKLIAGNTSVNDESMLTERGSGVSPLICNLSNITNSCKPCISSYNPKTSNWANSSNMPTARKLPLESNSPKLSNFPKLSNSPKSFNSPLHWSARALDPMDSALSFTTPVQYYDLLRERTADPGAVLLPATRENS